ncbi:hypothetical protein Bbelb_376670 [Branchiostoma belcheri]|nr:hypothetical protein Bbelb_376670 [Branchiostoma belcheri]
MVQSVFVYTSSWQTLRERIAQLESTVQRLAGTAVRNTETIREELLEQAKRPAAIFDPLKAMALVESLMDTARNEGHEKAEEFKLLVSQLRPHLHRPYFKELIIDQYSSGLLRQVNKGIATFMKTHMRHGGITVNQQQSWQYPQASVHSFPHVPQPPLQRFDRRPRGRGRRATPRPTDKCFRCWGLGHWAKGCTATAPTGKANIPSYELQSPVNPLEAYGEHLTNIPKWTSWRKDGASIVPPPPQAVAQGTIKAYINKGHFQTVCDDKSGYDHVLITETSKPLVGFQWGGWYYVCNTIAFGWKCPGYVYQKIGLVAMHKIRSLGVPSSLYIDDRHAGQLQLAVNAFDWSNYELAEAACFLLCYTLVDLGYTLGLDKSQLEPTQLPTFFGLLNRKKVTVAQLREDILQQTEVPVKLLQKLTGKIGSFVLAVPAARLFCREMFSAIAEAEKQGRMVKIEGTVRKELEYWRFLDTWEGHIPWKPENTRWAGEVSSDKDMTQCSDYWEQHETPEHISVKETRALTRTLISALLVAGPGQACGEGAKGSSSRRVGTTIPNQETGVDAETNEMGPLGFPDSASMFQGAARVWVPAVNCSECWYPNDFDFNFCQKCGKPREGQNAKNKGRCLEVNLTEINARYDEIMGTQENSAYGKQKRVLVGLLSEFLAALNPPKTLENAAPSDIVKFLIFKDDVGKTKVHKAGCQSNGPGLEACVCPNRLAFKTVDSHIGKLRAIFNERGKGGEWDERLGLGNPAASLVVKKYLKSVTEEQLQQGLTPRQAKPVFLENIVKVCKLIEQRRQLETSAIKIFILARDEAIFKALFFAGDRVSDRVSNGRTLDNAFRRYLEKAGLYEGETLHGCRAGCAISLHMAGASDDSLMNHIEEGWNSKGREYEVARIRKRNGVYTKSQNVIVLQRDVCSSYAVCTTHCPVGLLSYECPDFCVANVQLVDHRWRRVVYWIEHSTMNRETRVRFPVVPGACLNMRPDVVSLGKAFYTNFLTPPRCEWVPNFGWGKSY